MFDKLFKTHKNTLSGLLLLILNCPAEIFFWTKNQNIIWGSGFASTLPDVCTQTEKLDIVPATPPNCSLVYLHCSINFPHKNTENINLIIICQTGLDCEVEDPPGSHVADGPAEDAEAETEDGHVAEIERRLEEAVHPASKVDSE